MSSPSVFSPNISSTLSSAYAKGPVENPNENSYSLHGGNFRSVAFSAVQSVLFLLRIAKWKVAYYGGNKFDRGQQLPYFSRVPDDRLQEALDEIIKETFDDPKYELLRTQASGVISRLLSAKTVTTTIAALNEVALLHSSAVEALGGREYTPFSTSSSAPGTPHRGLTGKIDLVEADRLLASELAPMSIITDSAKKPSPPSHFTYRVARNPERLVISWPTAYGNDFLKATVKVADVLRTERRDPPFADFIAFHIGYHLLHQGQNPFNPLEARFLGTVGFRRDTQTYVSLTDPGDGHVFGTTRKTRWMRGAIVHVEHLERPQNLTRDSIESYRIPSIVDFARTRLHTGSEAPNTYFVGRALKDSGEFGFDFIKVVNTTSAAATGAYQLGAAECKVAMDGLKTSQMVAYMRGLAGHALRNHRQYFSAAFNLNHPIVDDLRPNEDGTPRVLSEQMDIGRRAVELAALGHFDKVTWDGAADSYPSECIILQLGFQNALELVHRAHSVGLTTYMSAGFKFHNIQDAVLSGVDGIGIGGAQILRYMDSVSGMHGPYTEEHIDKITVARDNAANSVRGRGVHLLARLDQMYFEGSLTETENSIREPLYEALYNKDEDDIQRILCDEEGALTVAAIPQDGERPWVGRAKRLLREESPVLKKGIWSIENGEALWDDFVRSLQILVDTEDDVGLHAYSQSEPWKSFRKAYRATLGESKFWGGENRVVLKITPYS
ncbi:hypothetical protein BDQ17DRAFT_857894 [Cyathus striatus]|nr:hypothetical protein BDQ17DRAFT_857894 [Cyathus striatus]